MVSEQSKRDYLPAVRDLGHERVFETRWETGSSATAQSRLLNLIDTPVVAHGQDVLRPVPVSSLQCAFNERITILVDVSENAVLVLQIPIASHAHGNLSHNAEHVPVSLQQAYERELERDVVHYLPMRKPLAATFCNI